MGHQNGNPNSADLAGVDQVTGNLGSCLDDGRYFYPRLQKLIGYDQPNIAGADDDGAFSGTNMTAWICLLW